MENYKAINRELVEAMQKMRLIIRDLQGEICTLREQLLINHEDEIHLKNQCRRRAIQLLHDVGTDSEVLQYLKAKVCEKDFDAEISNTSLILQQRNASVIAEELRRGSALFQHEELLRNPSPVITTYSTVDGENLNEPIDQEVEHPVETTDCISEETAKLINIIDEEDEAEECEYDESSENISDDNNNNSDKENSDNIAPKEVNQSRMTSQQLNDNLVKLPRIALCQQYFREFSSTVKSTHVMCEKSFDLKDDFNCGVLKRCHTPLGDESIEEQQNCSFKEAAFIEFNKNEFTNSTPCKQRTEIFNTKVESYKTESNSNAITTVSSRPNRKCKPTNLAEPPLSTKLRNESIKNLWLESPQNLSAEKFNENCMRYGRILLEHGYQKWRWIGFQFGLDLIIVFNFRIRRHHRNEHERLLSLQVKRQFMIRASITSINSQCQPVFAQKSELTSLCLEKNEEVILMTMNAKLIHPLLISVNLLVVPPTAQKFKEIIALNEQLVNSSVPISEIRANSERPLTPPNCSSHIINNVQEGGLRSIQEVVTANSLFSSKTKICPINVCNNSRVSTEKTLICLDSTTKVWEPFINARRKGFSGPTDEDDSCFSLVKDHSITLRSSPIVNNLPLSPSTNAVIRPV
uniref:Uncharacterized protein n=1 Tax=Glossina brevipalpis TaxID=37001 RepID=A0A1A9WEA4_9MUSC